MLFGSGFEDAAVEAMADAMRGCGDAGETSTDDSDLGTLEVCVERRRSGREETIKDPLKDLVEEEDRVGDELLEEVFETHCCQLSLLWHEGAKRNGLKGIRRIYGEPEVCGARSRVLHVRFADYPL